jgi:hypothetical protein
MKTIIIFLTLFCCITYASWHCYKLEAPEMWGPYTYTGSYSDDNHSNGDPNGDPEVINDGINAYKFRVAYIGDDMVIYDGIIEGSQ